MRVKLQTNHNLRKLLGSTLIDGKLYNQCWYKKTYTKKPILFGVILMCGNSNESILEYIYRYMYAYNSWKP